MEASEHSRRRRLVCVELILGCLVAYGASISFEFVNYDDPKYVTDNPHVKAGVTPRGLAWAFTTFRASNWHPLTWISHMVDSQVYGLAAGGHHLTNVLLHAANSALLFLLLLMMTGKLWRGAAVAALFAWHPLHVESVAWVSERKDVLSTFFGLLALAAYVRQSKSANTRDAAATSTSTPENRRSKILYGLSLLFFALSLLSKPMLVTLPCVLLLISYWPLGRVHSLNLASREFRRPLLESIPFFVLSIADSAVTLIAQRSGGAMASLQHAPLSHRAANAALAYVAYLRKTFWPFDLAVIYPLQKSFSVAHVGLALTVLISITLVAIAWRRSRPWFIVGWLWFIGTLVPAIGLVQVGRQAMADRYTYFPLIGVFIMVVWGAGEIYERAPAIRRVMVPAAATVLAGCLALTWIQASTWRNSAALFLRALAVTPDNVTALDNLGVALGAAGRLDDALKCYNAALRLAPWDSYVLLHKGQLLARREDTEGAKQLFRAAIRSEARLAAAHYHLAHLLAAEGKLDEAAAEYEACVRWEPDSPDAHYNLANALVSRGKLEEAAAHYRQSLQLDPDAADAHNNLGAVLVRLGESNEALAEFEAALKLRPGFAEAEDQLAGAWQKLGRPDLARAHYEAALKIDSALTHARLKLGLLMAQQGQFDSAEAELQTIAKTEPTNDIAWYNLAGIMAARGHWQEAASNFARVTELKPQDAEARARLGEALARAGKWNDAITAYERAAELTSRRNPEILAALDRAYARGGRFDEAIKTAEAVKQLADALNRPAIAEAAARRLEQYRAGKPYAE